MNWWKVAKYAAIAFAVIIVGGLAYDAIASRISLDRADQLIASIRADNQRIRGRLQDAQSRVVDLETLTGELGEGNRILKEQLDQSTALARSLREENQRIRTELGRLRVELDRSRETIGYLREENIRLGDAISSSVESTDAITESHNLLGESLGRALHILDRYDSGTGSE